MKVDPIVYQFLLYQLDGSLSDSCISLLRTSVTHAENPSSIVINSTAYSNLSHDRPKHLLLSNRIFTL